MSKPSFILAEKLNFFVENLNTKRLQNLDVSGAFSEETVRELANSGNVATISTEKSFDISGSQLQYGNLETLFKMADNSGSSLDIDDLKNLSFFGANQFADKNGNLIGTNIFPAIDIDSISFNFPIDDNASIDYTLRGRSQKVFTGSKADARITSGTYSSSTKFTIDSLYGEAMSITAEAVGTGDGSEVKFSLDLHPIVADSQTIYVDAVAKTEGVDYTIDDYTGVITFATAPGLGLAITADYDFAGNNAELVYIDGSLVNSSNWSLSGSTFTLSGGTEITATSDIKVIYIPVSQRFEPIVSNPIETPVIRRGQVDVYLYKSTDSEAKQLRVQGVTISPTFSKTDVYEMGKTERYDSYASESTVSVDLELNASDLEILAKSTGKYSEYVAGTLSSLDYDDIVRDMVLVLKIYDSENEDRSSATLLNTITVENMSMSSPSNTTAVGGIGTESFTYTADNISLVQNN